MGSENNLSQLTAAERAIVDVAQQWLTTPGMTVYLSGLQAGEMEINHDDGTLVRRTDMVRPQLCDALLQAGVVDARVGGRNAFDLIQAMHKDRAGTLNLTNHQAANQPNIDDADEPTPGTL